MKNAAAVPVAAALSSVIVGGKHGTVREPATARFLVEQEHLTTAKGDVEYEAYKSQAKFYDDITAYCHCSKYDKHSKWENLVGQWKVIGANHKQQGLTERHYSSYLY